MSESNATVSSAFQAFLKEAPDHARAWMGASRGLDEASALDPKTKHLAYLAVLVGLPAVGNAVVAALPGALSVFDEPAG